MNRKSAWRSITTLGIGLLLLTLGLPAPPAAAITSANAISYVYDELGRLEAVVDPAAANGIARYNYDGVGNLLSITRQSATATTIIDFHPKTAKRDATVTIYGAGFSSTPSQNTVRFGGSGGTQATVSAATTTQLVVTVPTSGTVDGMVYASSPSGAATSSQSFALDTSAPPTVTGFTPTSAASGSTVTISGTGFDASSPKNNNVFFNGIRAEVTAATSTSLTVLVPPFTTRGKISVQTARGEATSTDDFVVPPLGVAPSNLETVTRTTVGTPTTLSISANGKVSIAMFDGTEGERIFLDITSSTICFAAMSVRDPYGQVVGSVTFGCDGGFIDTMTLPVNGTYAVVLSQGGGSSTGSATFTLSNVPADLSGTLTPGTPVSGSITAKGQNANYTFSGSANQQATINVTGSTIGSGSIQIRFSDGTLLASTAFGSGNATLGPVTLPKTDTYTVRIDPSGRNIGDFTLTLSLSGGGRIQTPQQGSTLAGAQAPGSSSSLAEDLADFEPGSTEEWVPDRTSLSNWFSGRPDSPFQFLPPLRASQGVTALSGHVLRLDGRPLPGVTLRVGNATATSDQTGRFLLAGIASGENELEIDARTASTPEATYGMFHAAVRARAGRTTVLGYTIWMPKLDMAHTVRIASPTRQRVVIRSPLIPGLRVVIPKGSVVRDADGKIVHRVSITPIPIDRPPYPLFSHATMYFTLQPDGAEILPRGGRIVYPNYSALPAGSRHPLVIYEANEGGWEGYGYGRVTRDGRSIVPERGVRLRRLTGAGAVNAWIPAALDVLGNLFGDPVDASTGLFDYEKTDFVLPGPMPIRLTRLYRQSDMPVSGFQTPNKYMFGQMMSTNYEAYLYNPDFNPVSPQYTQMELIIPGERRVHFERTSLIPPNNPGDFENAVFEATATPGPFFKSTMRWQNGWILTRKDGTVLTFGGTPNLREIRDRFGNRVMVLGPGGSAPNPTSPSSYNPITQIVAYPSGRWLSFSYTNQLVTQVKDDLGRVANYTYDASSRMLTATDPNQQGQQNPKSTTYAWQTVTGCADQVMSSVTDPRQITFISNTYSTNGTCRVTDQFVPTDTHGVTDNFHFDYTPIGQGSVTQTDITDPIGNVKRTNYDSSGYLTSQTDAFGTPSARTFTYAFDPTTHRTTSVTDSFHSRRTDYVHDNFGNLTSVTRLAGTGGAATTSYTYDPVFQQLQTITDPLTHTTRFDYDTKGCLDIITDPMIRRTLFDCNGAGQVTSVTDPLSHTTQFTYSHGDVLTVTDPLGRATSRFTDGGGRVLQAIDPLNYVTGYAYDALNQLTGITDARSKSISFIHDEDGNLTQVKDDRNATPSTTAFAYNDQNLVSTRTDPLARSESFTYDNNGNLTLWTDRKSQVTEFRYDPFDRVTFTGFNRTGTPPYNYASTITYTYDVGGRLTQIADSTSGAGTITRGYDDLDRLTSEIQPNAASPGVVYTYYADGTRQTMSVPGQSQVSYTYNNAGQFRTAMQGSATVTLDYFPDARLQTLTLKPSPTPITQGYAYDDAGDLTQITYTHGSSTDDLSYANDATGRRTAVYGTYGRTSLPAATSANALYDLANRLTSWNGATATSDNNGNLTNDGTFAYTYNPRNQLTLVKQGNQTRGTFVYDGLGRRITRAVGNSTTKEVHDGWNLVQERASNNSVRANYLSGLALDQPFIRTPSSGSASYYLSDALGSIVGLASPTGTVPTTYTYEPYGKTTVSGTASASFLGFTGRENDATSTLSLYNYRARSYSPTLQRFMTEDPIGFAGGDVNMYAYAGQAPTHRRDPSGTCVINDDPCPGNDLVEWFGDQLSCAMHPTQCGRSSGGTPDSVAGAVAVAAAARLSTLLLDRSFQGCLTTLALAPSYGQGMLVPGSIGLVRFALGVPGLFSCLEGATEIMRSAS